MTVWLFRRSRQSKTRAHAALLLVFGITAVLGVLAWRQAGYWRDSDRLFTHAIATEDGQYIRSAFAATLMAEHRYAEAEPHLRVALQTAPDNWEDRNNLANVLLRTGRVEPASLEPETAVRLAADKIPPAETLALVRLAMDDGAGALRQFDRALRLGAEPAPIATTLNDAGASLASHGNPAAAEPLIRKATELNPTLVQARRNLVLVLLDQHRPAEAAEALNSAVAATGDQPDYASLRQELASATGQ